MRARGAGGRRGGAPPTRARGGRGAAPRGRVLALTAGDLADQAAELRERAERRTDLDALVVRAGGARVVRRCAPARTEQPMKAMVAWRLDVWMERLADPPRAPAVILAAPPGYGGPSRPFPPGGLAGARPEPATGRCTAPADAQESASARDVRVALALGQLHGHEACELGAAADVELAVDLAEVVLDRLGGEEERRRRLAVGHPLR